MKELIEKYGDWILVYGEKDLDNLVSSRAKYLVSLPLFVRSYLPEESIDETDVAFKCKTTLQFLKLIQERCDLGRGLSANIMANILLELAQGNTVTFSSGVIKRTER